MRVCRVVLCVVAAPFLLAPGASGDGGAARSLQVTDCDESTRARRLPTQQHWLVSHLPGDGDGREDPGPYGAYMWIRAADGDEPVRNVRARLQGARLLSEDGQRRLDFPDTRVKTDAAGSAVIDLASLVDPDDWESFISYVDDNGQVFVFFGLVDPLRGPRVDLFTTEFTVVLDLPCQTDADTLCVDDDAGDERWQVDFGPDRLEVDVPLPNGAVVRIAPFTGDEDPLWRLEFDRSRGAFEARVSGENEAAREMLDEDLGGASLLWGDYFYVTDTALGHEERVGVQPAEDVDDDIPDQTYYLRYTNPGFGPELPR